MIDYSHCQSRVDRLAHGTSPSTDNAVLHFFGCLRFEERQSFLDSLDDSDRAKQRIQDENTRIQNMRNIFEMEGHNTAAGSLLYRFKVTLGYRFPKLNNLPRPRIDPVPNARSAEARRNLKRAEEREKEFVLEDLNANIIYFKKEKHDQHLQPYDHPKFLPSKFPDQKIKLSQLLKDDSDSNPLMWKCEENMIRYFHLPANNMEWIEEAIARYYDERNVQLSGPYQKPRRPEDHSKTRMLLRPQYWRGLQHGNHIGLPTHTRHMRPRCYPISTDYQNLEPQPKNLALFMPYLHWETDRRRARSAEVVRRYGNDRWTPFAEVVDQRHTPVNVSKMKRISSDGFPEHITTIIEAAQGWCGPKKITLKSYQGQTLLGKLLLLAAALYEELDAYTDEKMVKHYLTSNPPLHPRRTLDQSYYWTLRDTRSRDRDQVVYRGTAPPPKLLHHQCRKKANKDRPCAQCQENASKVPRVVMVDQLWMWILDENTVITCFPKRFGRNKPDVSAVQKCIRTRLRAARIDEVRSVYDLAIIIIDQCSRVFFDRTQSEDLQPQVMDCFGNAIGRVTHKQSIAFDHFWECTRLASKRYNSRNEPDNGTAKKSQNVLLDINPEGDLLREIKDIMDEIFIMMLIKKQEETVARTFAKHIKPLIKKTAYLSNAADSRTSDDDSDSSRRHDDGLLASPVLRQGPKIIIPRSAVSEDYEWTSSSANELVERIESQLQELKYLQDAAENASLALKDLLSLKQQQAGVVEAREAVKQGEETLRQGRAIMLFTVITIIFLPMTFFLGVFGMNTTELIGDAPGSSNWKYKDVFKFMIPISSVVITCSLCLAFSKLVRAVLSYAFNISWTYFITQTSLYVTWRDTSLNSKWLHEDRKVKVNAMKTRAKQKALEEKMKQARRVAKLESDAKQKREIRIRSGNIASYNIASPITPTMGTAAFDTPRRNQRLRSSDLEMTGAVMQNGG